MEQSVSEKISTILGFTPHLKMHNELNDLGVIEMLIEADAVKNYKVIAQKNTLISLVRKYKVFFGPQIQYMPQIYAEQLSKPDLLKQIEKTMQELAAALEDNSQRKAAELNSAKKEKHEFRKFLIQVGVPSFISLVIATFSYCTNQRKVEKIEDRTNKLETDFQNILKIDTDRPFNIQETGVVVPADKK